LHFIGNEACVGGGGFFGGCGEPSVRSGDSIEEFLFSAEEVEFKFFVVSGLENAGFEGEPLL
jgi:hypothetical protein